VCQSRASAEKFQGGATEKNGKIAKKNIENITIKPLPGEGTKGKKTEK